MKGTKRARKVGLFAALGGVAEAIAGVALGVSVGDDRFLNLMLFGKVEEGRDELMYPVGVDGDNHPSRLFWIL